VFFFYLQKLVQLPIYLLINDVSAYMGRRN